jgi:hypothetical protein
MLNVDEPPKSYTQRISCLPPSATTVQVQNVPCREEQESSCRQDVSAGLSRSPNPELSHTVSHHWTGGRSWGCAAACNGVRVTGSQLDCPSQPRFPPQYSGVCLQSTSFEHKNRVHGILAQASGESQASGPSSDDNVAVVGQERHFDSLGTRRSAENTEYIQGLSSRSL